jgi:hypothetical protein
VAVAHTEVKTSTGHAVVTLNGTALLIFYKNHHGESLDVRSFKVREKSFYDNGWNMELLRAVIETYAPQGGISNDMHS